MRRNKFKWNPHWKGRGKVAVQIKGRTFNQEAHAHVPCWNIVCGPSSFNLFFPPFLSWFPFTVQRSVCWVNLKLYNGLKTHPECTLPVTAGTDSSHTPSSVRWAVKRMDKKTKDIYRGLFIYLLHTITSGKKRLLIQFQPETQIPFGVVSGRASVRNAAKSNMWSYPLWRPLVTREQPKVAFKLSLAITNLQIKPQKQSHRLD